MRLYHPVQGKDCCMGSERKIPLLAYSVVSEVENEQLILTPGGKAGCVGSARTPTCCAALLQDPISTVIWERCIVGARLVLDWDETWCSISSISFELSVGIAAEGQIRPDSDLFYWAFQEWLLQSHQPAQCKTSGRKSESLSR